VELMQLVQVASRAFERVALYFENSILKTDWELLPSAGAVANRYERTGERLIVESARPLGVRWNGGAKVNGLVWPVSDGKTVWLPAGSFVLESAPMPVGRILDFNGDLRTAAATAKGLELSYSSGGRALAVLSGNVRRLEVDGQEEKPLMVGTNVLALPRGQHLISIEFD
jgi:hypothetical protein